MSIDYKYNCCYFVSDKSLLHNEFIKIVFRNRFKSRGVVPKLKRFFYLENE